MPIRRGLDRRRLHAPGRRPGAGHGADRHLQEPVSQAVQGHRRAGRDAFLDRPLAGDWPYLWLDATYLKVREGGRIVSVAAIIAVAVRHRRHGARSSAWHRPVRGRDLLGRLPARAWSSRGLQGVKLVISDAHEGLKAAITRVVGATWQRCRVHWMRNALAHVPQGPAHRRRRRDPPGLHPARHEDRQPDLAPCRRPAPRPLAEARRADGRQPSTTCSPT